MKPINDTELRDIISKKIASVPDVETDHLWAGIESNLSSSSSGFMTGILKCILFVSSFVSVITISDSSGFAKEPNTQYQADLILVNEVAILPAKEAQLHKTSHAQNEILEEEVTTKVQKIEQPEEVYIDAIIRTSERTNRIGHEVMPIKPTKMALYQPSNSIAETHKIEAEQYNQKSNYFISISPYLTFHSMLPHAFDENYITSSASHKVTPASRLGTNISIGYVKYLSYRLMLSGSLGVDYYKTQFAYQIANHIDSDVLLSNHRIDGGLNIGFGYRLNTPLGQGTMLGESWLRHQIYDFHGTSSYNRAVAGYRFTYLIEFNGIQVGPTYGSFFTSRSNEMGQVKPQQFGFTIRKSLGNKN